MKSKSSWLAATAAFLFLANANVALADSCSTSKASHESSAGETAHEAEVADIVDTAVASGSFNTLVAAIKAAGLVEVLKGEGPFTVFAPTDEAFAKLPKGTLEELLKPDNKALLQSILTYHVVSGEVLAEDVVELDFAATVQGSDVAIRVEKGVVRVGEATVIATDIQTSNGVIHVIDSVILPEAEGTGE
jgi:uncharacterized surface protein with fasciclin (FAS1) repeats